MIYTANIKKKQNMEISISNDRVAVALTTGQTVQFVVWDLEKNQQSDLENQIKTAFEICSNYAEIEKHLEINGFDASVEDVYIS